MAFSSIDSTQIEVSKATKKELFDKIKNNFDDHETRIVAVEGASAKIDVFSGNVFNATAASTLTYLAVIKASNSFSLSEAKLQVYDIASSGLTGTIEIDILLGPTLDYSDATTVFTTKPSIAMSGVSDYDVSTNTVFDASNQDVSVGDYLFINVAALPANGVLTKFYLEILGEV